LGYVYSKTKSTNKKSEGTDKQSAELLVRDFRCSLESKYERRTLVYCGYSEYNKQEIIRRLRMYVLCLIERTELFGYVVSSRINDLSILKGDSRRSFKILCRMLLKHSRDIFILNC
jgi:hypothetical protein